MSGAGLPRGNRVKLFGRLRETPHGPFAFTMPFADARQGGRMFLDRERFKPAAEMRLSRDKSSIRVTIIDPKACELGEAVYAWITAEGKPVRIGTCGASAGKRLLSYPGYINRSLGGRGGTTPKWEALKWLNLLSEHGMLTAVVHQPEPTPTAAGLIRPYVDIERQLIRQHRPLLNRSRR
jgi:hypothetical protein